MKPYYLLLILLIGETHLVEASSSKDNLSRSSIEASVNISWLVFNSPVSMNFDLFRHNRTKPLRYGIGAAFFISPTYADYWTNHSLGAAISGILIWGKKRTQGEFRAGIAYNAVNLNVNYVGTAIWPVAIIGFRRSLKAPDSFMRAYIGTLGIGVGLGKRL